MHPRLITRCAWKGQSFLSDGIVWTSGSFVKWRLTFGDTSDLSLQPRLFPPALCFVWTPPTLCGYLVCKLTFRGGASQSPFSLRPLLTSNLHLERKSLFNYRPDFLSGPPRSRRTPRVICSTEWKCDISKLSCHRWNMRDEGRVQEG